MNQENNHICRSCGYAGSEVKVLGCECSLHVRCIPISIFANHRNAAKSNPQASNLSICCPSCTQQAKGFYIYPLSFVDLEEAGKQNVTEWLDEHEIGMKRKRRMDYQGDVDGVDSDDSAENAHAAASPFLLWSNNFEEGATQSDRLHFRTGRWSTAETVYVDMMIKCFDQRTLTVPHGMKLNEFLRDILMCKSSRLTKKMKNAKLSHRSYDFEACHQSNSDIVKLSQLQQDFLDSMSSQVTRLVLKYNMSRIWRMHFSNLCVQAGFDLIYDQDWLESLNEKDRRVSLAEEKVRQTRRKRLVKALRKDSMQSTDGIYLCSLQPQSTDSNQNLHKRRSNSSIALSSLTTHLVHNGDDNQPNAVSSKKSASLYDFSIPQETSIPVNDFSISSMKCVPITCKEDINSLGEDFSIGLLDMDEAITDDAFLPLAEVVRETEKDPFLRKIMSYIEEQSLPFHYIDYWVPSQNALPNTSIDNNDSFRLIHAGDISRHDLSSLTRYYLHEFGIYSKNFSFAFNAGLPGRVYSNLASTWESNIQNVDAQFFERVGGAKNAGIQTVVGIPVSRPQLGTTVVVLYSLLNYAKDEIIMRKCATDFQRFIHESKWSSSDDLLSSGDQAHQVSFSKPPQDVIVPTSRSLETRSDCGSKSSGSKDEIINADQAMEIANLLTEHMPQFDSRDKRSNAFTSLRISLLKCPNNVSDDTLNKLTILKKSYDSYCKAHRNESEIVRLLLNDWEFISDEQKQSNSPWGSHSMTHVDYSVQGVSPVTPRGEDSPVISKMTSFGSFKLPPPTISENGSIETKPSSSFHSLRLVSSTSLEKRGGENNQPSRNECHPN